MQPAKPGISTLVRDIHSRSRSRSKSRREYIRLVSNPRLDQLRVTESPLELLKPGLKKYSRQISVMSHKSSFYEVEPHCLCSQ
jgi:hypothetical protein